MNKNGVASITRACKRRSMKFGGGAEARKRQATRPRTGWPNGAGVGEKQATSQLLWHEKTASCLIAVRAWVRKIRDLTGCVLSVQAHCRRWHLSGLRPGQDPGFYLDFRVAREWLAENGGGAVRPCVCSVYL